MGIGCSVDSDVGLATSRFGVEILLAFFQRAQGLLLVPIHIYPCGYHPKCCRSFLRIAIVFVCPSSTFRYLHMTGYM